MELYICRIYKIINTEDDKIYIGSTKSSLSQRMSEHRRHCKRKKKLNLHIHMNSIGIKNFHIETLEEKEVESRTQQLMLESIYIKKLNPELNKLLPYVPIEEQKINKKVYNKKYKTDNKEDICDYNKDYYEKNKEREQKRKKIYMREKRSSEEGKLYQKEYAKINKDKINARRRERRRLKQT